MTPNHFINRELSWIEFNQRVLDQAIDSSVPILERLKFLAITCTNLDEFFMVRVGGLQLQRQAGVNSTDPSGMSVQEQLDAIYARLSEMLDLQYRVFLEDLEPALLHHGIQRIRAEDCSVKHQEAMLRVFNDEILPVLSPMGIDPGDEFPLLSSHTLHLAVHLKSPDAEADEDPERFAIIPLGSTLARTLTLPTDSGFSFALLEDVVRCHVSQYFPEEEIISTACFRITRNADISLQEDGAYDLLHDMKDILAQRKTAECVRLEIAQDASSEIVTFLQSRLRIAETQTVRSPDPLDLSFLMRLSGLEGFDHLRNELWPSQRSPAIDPAQSMFATLSEQDLVLCHPYESYAPVVRLIEEASVDPDVLAIKQTLYRTSRDSAIVAALLRAAKRGKYVTTIVELKARFDEARNIEWAEELEQNGVQVIYGVRHLKTHAKICIIVRREPQGIVRYVHFGTGNYNESTAQIYSDISYFTCNDKLGKEASTFFNAISGYSQPQQMELIEAAPLGLRKKILSLIDNEIERRKQGQRASIMAKLNALVDRQIIEALYRASQAGVTVQLNIRGICCLRPGVPGLSENITVVSIVDRVLEHARMVCFHHGGDELMYISSADWMPRNLDKRVELLVPVVDKGCKKQLIALLETYFRDNYSSWQLNQEGDFVRRESGELVLRAQETIYQRAVDALKLAEQNRSTIFEPYHSAGSEQE